MGDQVNSNELVEYQKFVDQHNEKKNKVKNFVTQNSLPPVPVSGLNVCPLRGVGITHDDWVYDNEEDLWEMWNALQNHIDSKCLYMLDKGTFRDFCVFMSRNTSLDMNPYLK